MRIAGLDPGKQRDSFAFVGTKVENKAIYVLGAKRWLGRAYLDVEKEIASIHTSQPFTYYVVERNNTGEHVIEVLKRNYSLPVLAVTTGRELKTKEKIYSPKVMDKNEMVKYMIVLIQEKKLIFPKIKTMELTELDRQMSIFAEHKTDAGKFTYHAEGQEHDDLVMALMLACFIGRYYINKKEGVKKSTGVSRKFLHEDEDLLGSGVPEEYVVHGRAVWNP